MIKPFGANSLKIRLTLHPDLVRLVDTVNSRWQCSLLSGGRTIKEQADFVNGTNLTGVNPDRTVKSQTMNSKHVIQSDGFSHAVDWGPDPVNFDKKNYQLNLIYFHGFVMATARELGIRVRYGGDWDRNNQISDESFIDSDHTELED